MSKPLPQADQDKNANVSVAATTDTAIVSPPAPEARSSRWSMAHDDHQHHQSPTVPGGAHDHTFEVNNGKTRLIWLTDTSYYVQSDGMIHVTSDQAVSMFALSVGHSR